MHITGYHEEFITVGCWFAAGVFFKGLGLRAMVMHLGEQPAFVSRFIFMPSHGKAGTCCKICPVTFTLPRACVVPEAAQARLGEGSATAILLIAPRIIKVLVLSSVMWLRSHPRLVIKPIGGLFEGIVLHRDTGYRDSFTVTKSPDTTRLCTSAREHIAHSLRELSRIHVVICNHQAGLISFVLKKVMAALFRGQPLKELQACFTVLNTVFAFCLHLAQIKASACNPSLNQQRLQSGAGIFFLENSAVLGEFEPP